MPYRKTIFTNDQYYHLYNRGVEKRIIFLNQKDFQAFLEIMIYYLVPDQKWLAIFSRKPQVKISHSVTLLGYCLMPNHFHFLIQQKKSKGITTFMHALGVTYSMYFNKKYKRVGSLFQGRFKAKLVESDDYLLQLSKYIHVNPAEHYPNPLAAYPYSSYRFYLEGGPKQFINTEFILAYFNHHYKNLEYRKFVEEKATDFSNISPLLLE